MKVFSKSVATCYPITLCADVFMPYYAIPVPQDVLLLVKLKLSKMSFSL